MGNVFQRSLGLELSGPRSNKSVAAALDRYDDKNRWVLSDIHVFRELNDKDPDQAIIEQLNQYLSSENVNCNGVGVNAPLSFPPYLKIHQSTPLPLPDESTDEEVLWMQSLQKRIEAKTPSVRKFIPYLQRPTEIYLRTQTPERFPIADAFSANGAALAARMHFIGPYLKMKKNEVYVKGSVVRICQSLKMPKFVELGYSSLTGGLESRHEFFVQLQKSLPKLFLYEEHIEAMTLHLYMFNAFISAITQQLISLKATEDVPHNFPKNSSWIHLPKSTLNWDKIFS